MTNVEQIDEHLTFERNKNFYLVQKNESLRSANQHFAKSYEALKLKVNELAQERAAWYEKNVSLHFEKNRLKRSLLSYKDMLCKTSSKNKGLLLNLKSAFDDLMRDTTFLDEFITSLPHDIDTGGFEDEVECDSRFMFKSPQCQNFPTFKPMLSPIPEEELDVTIKSCSSNRTSVNRSRLGRRASKKIENLTDKIKNSPPDDNASSRENEALQGHSVWTTAGLKDKEASGVQDGAGHSTIKLANLGDHDICNSAAETGRGLLESAFAHTTEIGLVDRDEKMFTFAATHNVDEGKSEDTGDSVSEQKRDKAAEGSVCLQSFASPFATLKRKKNFFSPLPDKENYTMSKAFENCPPVTPSVACKSAYKRPDNLKNSRWDLGKLSILMNSFDSGLDINTKCEEEGPQDDKSRNNDSNILNSSMKRKKLVTLSTGNKRKMNRSVAEKYKLETSRKKRKSVFEVHEKNFDDVEGEDVRGNNDRFCCDDQKKMISEEVKCVELLVSDELVTTDKEPPKSKVRSRQRKTPVKATKKQATPSRKNKLKADGHPPEITDKIQTRARSKRTEDNGKTRYAEKSNKSGSEGKRSASKRKPQNGARVVVTRNKGKKIPSDKSEEAVDRKRPSTTASPEARVKLSARESSSAVKCLTRSTPKLITGSLDTTDFNEISLSPIKKSIQDNNKDVRTTTAKQCKLKTDIDVQRFEKDANSNKQENKDVLSQKKYVVFSDLLKATANLKVATQDDIFQIKKFLINIGCGAKKVERKSAADIKPPDQELPKEDSFTSIISDKEINSLLSTISPSLATVIRSLEIEEDEGR